MVKNEKFFHIPVWQRYYVYLLENQRLGREEPMTRMARELDITYSHVNNIANKAQKKGHLEIKRSGRIAYVYLTKEGERKAKAAEVLVKGE